VNVVKVRAARAIDRSVVAMARETRRLDFKVEPNHHHRPFHRSREQESSEGIIFQRIDGAGAAFDRSAFTASEPQMRNAFSRILSFLTIDYSID